jgi:Mrp family chromosome partitioning ATPase
MKTARRNAAASTLRLLEQLPGISDVVWSALTHLDGTSNPVRLVFASAEPRAGTTVIAAATAIGLVRHRRVPVCLVETHVARPALAGYLGLRHLGLTDILDGRAELKDCLQEPRGCPDLYVLPAGTPRPPVAGEFTTERMRALLEQLGHLGRYLVLDAPALLSHIESRLLLKHADGALLVLRAGVTRSGDAQRAQRIVHEAGVPVLGSVFNAYGAAGEFALERHADGSPDDGLAAVANEGQLPARVLGASQPLARPSELPELVSSNGHAPTPSTAVSVATVAPDGWISVEVHRGQIDVLERRIAKLTSLLEKTELTLRHIAALKDVDPGIASIYRGVQGLSPEADALASKRELLQKIFQANLELKQAIALRR